MYIGSLFSGGKDSVFSAYKAIADGHELKCLITIISQNPESYMYHVPNIDLTRLQAEAMELPIIMHTTKGEKEKEVKKPVLRQSRKHKPWGSERSHIFELSTPARRRHMC